MTLPTDLRALASWARFPVLGVVVTAADRAAATLRRGGTEPLRPLRGHLPFQGRLCREYRQKAPSAKNIFHHPLLQMIPPYFCGRRRGVAATPPQVTVSRSSDTTKGLCDRPLETFARPLPEVSWCPALVGRGGSVSRRDHNQAYRRPRSTSQAEPTMQKQPRQTPTALRERGSGGEALLSEKRPLPQNLPIQTVSSEGSAREGASLQRSPLPRIIIFHAPLTVGLRRLCRGGR